MRDIFMTRHTLRRLVLLLLVSLGRIGGAFAVLVMWSCSPSPPDGSDGPHVGSVRQALTDTDGDGMDDDWETLYFGNLAQSSAGDFDSDGMTNGEEYLYGFNPTVQDSFEDADGDRYPNVFEIRNGGDPNNAGSTPMATFVVCVA